METNKRETAVPAVTSTRGAQAVPAESVDAIMKAEAIKNTGYAMGDVQSASLALARAMGWIEEDAEFTEGQRNFLRKTVFDSKLKYLESKDEREATIYSPQTKMTLDANGNMVPVIEEPETPEETPEENQETPQDETPQGAVQ